MITLLLLACGTPAEDTAESALRAAGKDDSADTGNLPVDAIFSELTVSLDDTPILTSANDAHGDRNATLGTLSLYQGERWLSFEINIRDLASFTPGDYDCSAFSTLPVAGDPFGEPTVNNSIAIDLSGAPLEDSDVAWRDVFTCDTHEPVVLALRIESLTPYFAGEYTLTVQGDVVASNRQGTVTVQGWFDLPLE